MRPAVKQQNLTKVADGFNLLNLKSDLLITGITHNSREVQPGDIYVALKGSNFHGIEFLAEAISRGAVAVATDHLGLEKLTSTAETADPDIDLPVIELPNPRADMALLAARVYGHPEQKLTIVGVTGTNGKTSVTHMLQSVFTTFGYRVGVIGTIGTYVAGEHLPGVRTTPESTDLFAILAKMVEAQITHVFMEVSSHALELNRVDGIIFDQAVFTNLSQDHLDFHGTMDNYFSAKAKLFTVERARHAVICIDDTWGKKLAENSSIPVRTVGDQGDWNISDLRLSV